MLPELEPLLQELGENRRLLEQSLGNLREMDEGRSPRKGEYTPRQVLAHLAGAERGMTRLMRSMAAGEQPRLKADYNNDYYNARQQEKRASMSVAELRGELKETRRNLLEFVASLKAEELVGVGEHPVIGEATVLGVLRQLQIHERQHILEMNGWLDELHKERV